MKIAHISDIHGDLDACATLEDFLKENDDIGVAVISGDILGQCLSQEQAEQMHKSFQYILQHAQPREKMQFEELLEILKRAGGDFKKAAETYEKAEKVFDKNAEDQYIAISNIFERVPQEVLTIPGNWDSKHYFKYFGGFESNLQDIHKKSTEVEGVKFAGYGEAPESIVLLPPSRTIGYSEEELYRFFVKESPDIAVTHVPPFEIKSDEKHEGSMANLAAMLKTTPDLLLCGHCHGSKGAEKEETSGTIVDNPGNLGEYPGDKPKGVFTIIERDGEGFVSSITPYRIGDDGIVYKNGRKPVAVGE